MSPALMGRGGLQLKKLGRGGALTGREVLRRVADEAHCSDDSERWWGARATPFRESRWLPGRAQR
jgi:hypothetical protein